MKTPLKILTVAVLAGAVFAVVAFKNQGRHGGSGLPADLSAIARRATAEASGEGWVRPAIFQAGSNTDSAANAKLPKLLDLGAGKCIPCKAMTPILEELKKEYVGRLNVEFIDVGENEDAGKQYGVEMIPTQIFYDAAGKELYRHVGFFGKEDILAKWKELGVEVSGGRRSADIIRKTSKTTEN